MDIANVNISETIQSSFENASDIVSTGIEINALLVSMHSDLSKGETNLLRLREKMIRALAKMSFEYDQLSKLAYSYNLFLSLTEIIDGQFEFPNTFHVMALSRYDEVDAFAGLDSQDLKRIMSNILRQLHENIFGVIGLLSSQCAESIEVLTKLADRFDNESDTLHRLDIKKSIRETIGTGNSIDDNLEMINYKFSEADDAVKLLAACLNILNDKAITKF